MSNIFERIARGEFYLDEPYPEKPDDLDESADIVDILERTDVDADYRQAVAEYREKQKLLLRRFREALEAECGMVGHPKANKVYALAWEYMHRRGLVDVASMYYDLAELVLGNDLN